MSAVANVLISSDDVEQLDMMLAEESAKYYADPIGWAYWAFDWGHGELEGFDGLDTWQEQYLFDVGMEVLSRGFDGINAVDPIRFNTASGHGIGKSALVAILILWIMSTRANAKGIVTANTGDQLRTKTWGELAKWKRRCIVGHWFEYNNSKGSMNMYHPAFAETWRVDAITCREENSEAFAGLHNATSTPFYIFDEASAVPDSIWEVAEGGLTDGEPMFHVFGNPTRNTGKFRETFNSNRWKRRQIDSREARMTNKNLIDQWIKDYGEDSDFVRVRVRGMFPKGSDLQYFPSDVVFRAMTAPTPRTLRHDPLICGIDYARGGNDNVVVRFRRGRDARSEKTYVVPGEHSRDSEVLAQKLAVVLRRHMPDVINGDVGSMGGPINDRLRSLGFVVNDIGFGHNAQNEDLYSDRTSEMSARALQWLLKDGVIPYDVDLEQDLVSREFGFDLKDRLKMESKKSMKLRIGRSPDDMDAFLLTFAVEVHPHMGLNNDNEGAPGHRGEAAPLTPEEEDEMYGRPADYDPLDVLNS